MVEMKNRWMTFLFSFVLLAVFGFNIILPDKSISFSERRYLEVLPRFSKETVLSGAFFKSFEKYQLDQMILREPFRTIKASMEFFVFNKYDNNDIFIKDGFVFKMDYPYQAKLVDQMGEKMNAVYETYLKDMKVYYSIIPDKNYYIKDWDHHLSIDYEDMIARLKSTTKEMAYIDIFDQLTLEDYYRSDIHWKQENLEKVIATLGSTMDFSGSMKEALYEKKTFSPFYGSYYGQAALPLQPDTLTYLTNSEIEGAIVDYYEAAEKSIKIYDPMNLLGIDAYDVFLSGPAPLVTINNPNNHTGKELIIFRDSFASSLAPLLLGEYSTITLVDLRYIHYALLDEYIQFDNQDVLFLYSTTLVNNSSLIKV